MEADEVNEQRDQPWSTCAMHDDDELYHVRSRFTPPQKKIKNSDVDHFSRYAKTSLAQFPWVPRPASQCQVGSSDYHYLSDFQKWHSALDWLYFDEFNSKKLRILPNTRDNVLIFKKSKGQ